jgi:ATP-dependent RNA helicase RhlE
LHGNKSQGARTKALEGFKQGNVTALIATDIAARGLDIDQLPHVVNYDLPAVAEDYVHRIGRTGRAGAEGEAISLVTAEEAHLLFAIEKVLNKQIPRESDTGYEPVLLRVEKKAKSKPKVNQQRQNTKTDKKRNSNRYKPRKNTSKQSRKQSDR